MSRRAIELRSDINDIDYLFAIAETANTLIQNFVDEQVKAVFGINSEADGRRAMPSCFSRFIENGRIS